MFSEYAICNADSPPISFWMDFKAENMDWLNAISVVALGITTAMRNGLACAAETLNVVASSAIASATIFKLRKFILFSSFKVPALFGKRSSTYSSCFANNCLRIRLVLASLKRFVQRNRLPHKLRRQRQCCDCQNVRQHHRQIRWDLDVEHLHPQLKSIDRAEQQCAAHDCDWPPPAEVHQRDSDKAHSCRKIFLEQIHQCE